MTVRRLSSLQPCKKKHTELKVVSTKPDVERVKHGKRSGV